MVYADKNIRKKNTLLGKMGVIKYENVVKDLLQLFNTNIILNLHFTQCS